jgi:hypothetical protein
MNAAFGPLIRTLGMVPIDELGVKTKTGKDTGFCIGKENCVTENTRKDLGAAAGKNA